MSTPDTPSCAEVDALLAEQASGPLEVEEAAALDSHLSSCASCRAAAERWRALFSLVALAPPRLKEEAAMRDLPQRTLLAWQQRERRLRRVPALAAAGLLAAAALLLVFGRSPNPPQVALPATELVAQSESTSLQLEWTDGPTWEMDEPEATDTSSDDGVLLDGLAIEGDGAFSLGDSG